MNNFTPNPKLVRKPLPKSKVLRNSGLQMKKGAAAVPTTGYTCNPCIQTENDRCFLTKGICG